MEEMGCCDSHRSHENGRRVMSKTDRVCGNCRFWRHSTRYRGECLVEVEDGRRTSVLPGQLGLPIMHFAQTCPRWKRTRHDEKGREK